jgi:hypothetical protein
MADHRLLHVSVGIVRSIAGPSDALVGRRSAIAPVLGRVTSLACGPKRYASLRVDGFFV